MKSRYGASSAVHVKGNRLCRYKAAVYNGSEYPELYAAVLTAMGMDSDAIAEEFQAVKASKGRNGSVTPTLDQYSRDLTEMAEGGKLDPVVGSEERLREMIQILSRRTKTIPA